MKALIAEFDKDSETITIVAVDMGRDLTPPSMTRRVTHIDSPGVLLGHRTDDPFEHQLSTGAAVELRDFLIEMYPLRSPKSDLADLQKHLLEPYVPGERGDIVTVIKSADFDGAGEPHVVVSFGTGFAWRHGRSADGIKQTRHLEHIEAEVTLARKGPDGKVVTQVVPVWAIRRYDDPAIQSTAA